MVSKKVGTPHCYSVKEGGYPYFSNLKTLRLFSFSISEILRKIGQPYEDDAQSGHIDDVDVWIKHAGEDYGKTGPKYGPDDENVKLGQNVTSFQSDGSTRCFIAESGYIRSLIRSILMGKTLVFQYLKSRHRKRETRA